MAKKKKGELPSGNIRRKVYDHSELVFDDNGKPVIDPKTGKQKKKLIYRSITAESTKEVEMLKAQAKAGMKRHTTPQKMTLREGIDKYISSSDAILSPSTIRGYRSIQRNAFASIMDVQLIKITNELLREAVNEECKRKKQRGGKPLSPKTVINNYGLLSSVLNMYAPNLDVNVKLPQVEHNKNEISKPEVIYEVVKGTDIELPVLLAMWLSLTVSEIKGLTKSGSISTDGNFITVKNVVVKDENNKDVIKTKGKQPSRDRTLQIPDHIKRLIDNVETDVLVTISSHALYMKFRKLIEKAGLPYMTFHDLRHVNASVMAMLNVPDKYAQERGGWSTDHIMKSVYQQTFSSERSAVDEKIDDYFQTALFSDASEIAKKKKYESYLILFDLVDSEDSQKSFDDFCQKNMIKV
jgi:hypothetical protein